jgi:hypothetical protein
MPAASEGEGEIDAAEDDECAYENDHHHGCQTITLRHEQNLFLSEYKCTLIKKKEMAKALDYAKTQ